jgi:hypothetical protein
MEPLFRHLVIGLVPQPTQIPPAPFPAEDLQRAYFDVSRMHPYQQFGLLPGDGGAHFLNSPDDSVTVQPALLQVRTPIELTAERAREKVVDVVRGVTQRLGIESYFQTGIKVVAHVSAPGESPSARAFVAERLMQGADRIDELGPSFFAGGLKYWSLEAGDSFEQVLLVEPLLRDDRWLFVDYDAQRRSPSDGSQLGEWIADAFKFVSGPAMRLLEA